MSGLTQVWDAIKDRFQTKLVSGTNIKTINNQSLIGSGNITTPNTTYSQATADVLGLVKIGATGLQDKQYPVQLDSQGRMYVDVPWIDTQGGSYTLPAASTTVRGGIKVGNGLQISNTDVLNVNIDLSNYLTLSEGGIIGDENGNGLSLRPGTLMFHYAKNSGHETIVVNGEDENLLINFNDTETSIGYSIKLRRMPDSTDNIVYIENDIALTEEEITAILV